MPRNWSAGEQIAANITISEDPEARAEALAGHIGRFWDPRMRETLDEYLADHGDGVQPVVRRAAEILSA